MTKKKLLSHQTDAIDLMDARGRLLLWYEMGTGKTAIALHWALQHLREKNGKPGDIQSVLVVCPAAVVPNWHDAILHMDEFEGVTKEDIELMKKSIYVTSYQKTYQSNEVPKKVKGRVVTKKEYGLRKEVDRRWGAVIYDESHNIGVHSSRQTKAAHTLAKLAKYRFELSGTPVSGGKGKADWSKLYGQVRFLYPDVWPTWSSFCKEVVTGYDYWGKPNRFDEAKCNRILSSISLPCRLADVVDMPEKVDIPVPCELVEKRIYEDFIKMDAMKYGVDIVNPGTVAAKLRQISSGFLKKDDGSILQLKCSKDDALRVILEGTDEKIIIFALHTESLRRCERICKEYGRKTLIYSGGTKADAYKQFTEGDVDAIIIQFQKGSFGLNLQNAHIAVYYEGFFGSGTFGQSKARIWRNGQTQTCVYYYLYCTNTADHVAMWTGCNGLAVTDAMIEECVRTGNIGLLGKMDDNGIIPKPVLKKEKKSRKATD